MSVSTSFPSRPDHLAFLPHAPTFTTSRTLPASFASLPGPSRFRSSTVTSSYSQSGYPISSKSAPASPMNRPALPHGLAPLSSVSSMDLDPSAAARPIISSQRHISYPVPVQPPSQDASKSKQYRPSAQARPIQFSSVGAPIDHSWSRSRMPPPASSSEETETEMDSDSTFVPGRVKHRISLSQPDLTDLRSWAGGVYQGQLEEKRARDAKGPRSKPIAPQGRSAPVKAQSTFLARSSLSKSQPSLVGLRGPPSHGQTPSIPPMTPVSSRQNLSSVSEGSSSPKLGTGGVTGSEDADDDYESTDSPSSGSLTFSPKRTHRTRRRDIVDRAKGLGLSTEPAAETDDSKKEDPLPLLIERKLQQSSLLSLRLLAIIPSVWGICVLVESLATGGLWRNVWPWGVDLSREALERLVQGGAVNEGTWCRVPRGDLFLAIAWAMATAHFCFRLTTGLTHRWRSYYSLPSTITRLISLQCLCYPATYITLWFLGADRPLLAWIVIGVTTGWSRTVQMWVTSNVVPDDRGDMTPGAKKRSPRLPPMPPKGLSAWESFTYGRKWEWDAVAGEVGWKVGSLLLVTTAWLFWGIETGRLVHA